MGITTKVVFSALVFNFLLYFYQNYLGQYWLFGCFGCFGCASLIAWLILPFSLAGSVIAWCIL